MKLFYYFIWIGESRLRAKIVQRNKGSLSSVPTHVQGMNGRVAWAQYASFNLTCNWLKLSFYFILVVTHGGILIITACHVCWYHAYSLVQTYLKEDRQKRMTNQIMQVLKIKELVHATSISLLLMWSFRYRISEETAHTIIAKSFTFTTIPHCA